MSKKFKFKKASDYGRSGPIFYKSLPQKYKRDFEICKAEIRSRVNGPKTAYAKITFYSTFYTNMEFGYYLYAHFSGWNCYRQAERWCNWLLNNYPTGNGNYKVAK